MTGLTAGLQLRTGWTVGLNHGPHDSACALLKDGALVVSIEQERLSRHKQAIGESPAHALRYCLDFAGIQLPDIDAVALGSHHALLAAWMGENEQRAGDVSYDSPEWLFPETLFGTARHPPLIPVRHHIAHAGSGYWPSGFDEAAILVMDAMGEDSSTSLAVGTADGIEIIEDHPVDVSLGFFYEAAAQFAGLGRRHAGKLMGLAAYGKPSQDVGLHFSPDGISWGDLGGRPGAGRAMIEERMRRLVEHFELVCYPYNSDCTEDIAAYADFAASVQAALEQVVLGLAERLRRLSGSPDVVIAGGVGLNCSANGALADAGVFERVWVQPMAHDSGVALGAALATAHDAGQDVRGWTPMRHAYWGVPTDDADVDAELKRHRIDVPRLPTAELLARTARVLADGGIVAWHQGRSEVGPRALGARSLLGDPRSRRTLVRLNQAKRREMWRPLAPSVLADRFSDYFDGTPNEFMIVAAQVRPEVRRRIPAVVHVDGSARPQAVSADTNPRYAGLLTEFERLTGIPLVVNTSLNVADEPLCASAADSVRTFLRSGADALAIGPYLVRREDVSSAR
ncbi:carbamoyltransferase [Streptomyces canus]|uniref:carbamoyltransferase family protein n=1 Tax=Streptomyces canus TaxID=58343 RepID=UPI00371FE7DF